MAVRTTYAEDGVGKLFEYDTDAGTYTEWGPGGEIVVQRELAEEERRLADAPEPPTPVDVQGLAAALDELILTVLMGGL